MGAEVMDERRRNPPLADIAAEVVTDALVAGASSAGAMLAQTAANLLKNPGAIRAQLANPADDEEGEEYVIETDPEVIEVAQDFHGRKEVYDINIEVPLATLPEHLAGLGLLVELKFVAEVNGAIEDIDIPFDPEDDEPVIVAYSKQENQIYFVGGLEQQDLAAGFPDETTRFVNMGPCTYIAYFTDKHHLQGMTKEQEAGWPYHHLFGEETGDKPTLVFDRETRTLSLIGGAYWVEPDGIHN